MKLVIIINFYLLSTIWTSFYKVIQKYNKSSRYIIIKFKYRTKKIYVNKK